MGLFNCFGHAKDEQKNALRYSQVGIITDSDDDGTDIKCTLLHNFATDYTELSAKDLLFIEYNLPISEAVDNNNQELRKIFKEKDQIRFHNVHAWEKIWAYQYFKGPSSFNTEDAFQNYHTIDLRFDEDARYYLKLCATDNSKDGEFTKTKKKLISEFKENQRKIANRKIESISTVILQDYVQYLVRENARKIPSLVDGLNESKRKIL